jgi:hypothetical protein
MPKKDRPIYTDLAEYARRTNAKRVQIAKHLGVSRFKYAGLQNPKLYSVPFLSDELVAAIATLLNQTENYVRDYYARAKEAA